MDQRDFKKLLIDLDLSATRVAREVDLSVTGLRKYFAGRLRSPSRRARIRSLLEKRASERGVALPPFWQDRK